MTPQAVQAAVISVGTQPSCHIHTQVVTVPAGIVEVTALVAEAEETADAGLRANSLLKS